MTYPWPSPFPKITAVSALSGTPATGISTRYTRGSSELWLDEMCFLTVESGDSLSAYSQVLYGNFNEIHVWGRISSTCAGYPNGLSDLEKLTDVNLIVVGETLVHAGELLASLAPAPKVPPKPKLPTRPPPKVVLPMGMEIVAADRYDKAGWAEYISTFPGGGYVIIQDVVTFVFGVQAAVKARPVSILHIQVHGHPGRMYFGDPNENGETLSAHTFAHHRVTLQKLKQNFAPNAWVVVRSCRTGQDLALLRQLRDLWQVNIFAGTGNWNNALDFNSGMYVVLERGGAEYYTKKMPDEIQSSLARRAWKNW